MEGRYIYCVAEGNEEFSFGRIGIEGDEVYTVPFDGISAIVHNAPASAPDCKDREKVVGWVVSHQDVVDKAWRRYGTILPIRFHTVIKGGADDLKEWLEANQAELRKKLARLRGRGEYGVQVSWDADIVAGRLVDAVPALRDLHVMAKAGTGGAAYMYGQLLGKALKREMEKEAERYFQDIFHRMEDVAERVIIEETKSAGEGLQMIVNLSILIPGNRYEDMKEELEIVGRREGLSVRVTGPWPPYSFVEL